MTTSKDFSSLDKMYAYMELEIKKTIQQDYTNVKNVVVATYIDSIKEDVYDAYDSPAHAHPYHRLEEHGGLIDPSNFRVEPAPNGVAISSSREGIDGNGNAVDVMEVIEGHKPWAIEDVWGYGFSKPRHAVLPTINKLRSKQSVLNRAFALDMQNRGFNVE